MGDGWVLGVVGLVLAVLLTNVLVALSPASIPFKEQVSIDGVALVFTISLTILVGVSVGLIPALQTTKTNLGIGLNQRMFITRKRPIRAIARAKRGRCLEVQRLSRCSR